MPILNHMLRRIGYLMYFLLFVLYEIILANLRVAYAVLMPRLQATPALIDIPLSCTNDVQITVLANVISLTPGTLMLEISADKKTMLLHVMFFSDKQQLITQLKAKYEKPIMEIWP